MKYFKLLLFASCFFLNLSSFAQGGDHYTNGLIEMDEKNYPKAAFFFEKALIVEPNNLIIYNALALAHIKMNKYTLADSILSVAINIDSQYLNSFWLKGVCAVKLRTDSMAIVWYKKFIDLSTLSQHNNSGYPTKAHWEIIQAYYRLLMAEGLSKFQLDDLRNVAAKFERLLHDGAPERRVVANLMDSLSPSNPNFVFENDRYFLK